MNSPAARCGEEATLITRVARRKKTTMNYTYLFGPVQSRRLGVSLGIDMLRSKTCSLNCVYCECGTTAMLTLERKEYASAGAIISELTEYLKAEPKLDYITFGGSGEPTLNTALGRVVRHIKKTYPNYPCALLTNGTLFFLPDVRDEASVFDLVLPNLDAVSVTAFNKINRPHHGLTPQRIIDGLISFRNVYHGLIWLEVFIVPGINDTDEELKLLREAAEKIRPDRIQLNTLDRPGTCTWVKSSTAADLHRISRTFSPLPVEVIARHDVKTPLWESADVSQEMILSLISRRPSTAEEIAGIAGQTINQIQAVLSSMVTAKTIVPYSVGNRTFYRILGNKTK
jgi:wyosine [tRNA(Phe)-imidazoG37] synthetase (radical SAM superfamily)